MDKKLMRAIVRYDGYNYAGFQLQENEPTIQQELEKALSRIHKHPVGVIASGRTDAKVHALGQVIQFESDLDLSKRAWLNALNTILPLDIRIADVEEAPEGFHARFSAKKKRYRYIYTLDQSDPFAYRTKSRIFKKPDVEKMKEGARLLLGKHDFKSFTKALKPGKSSIKTIDSIEIIENGEDIELVFEGDGFLRHQVRRMSESLLNLGLGKLDEASFVRMIEGKLTCPYKAKGEGLYLEQVFYEDSGQKGIS